MLGPTAARLGATGAGTVITSGAVARERYRFIPFRSTYLLLFTLEGNPQQQTRRRPTEHCGGEDAALHSGVENKGTVY